MGRQTMWGLVAVAALALVVTACANCPLCRSLGIGTGKKAETGEAPAAASIQQKTCPVMGGKIDPKVYVDHEGRRIYFCCPACPETFKKNPSKYLAKLDRQTN